MTLEEFRNDGPLKAALGSIFASKEFKIAVELTKQAKLVPRKTLSPAPGLSPETHIALHYSSMVGAQDLLDFLLGLPLLSAGAQKSPPDVPDTPGFDEQNAPYRTRLT
jgi:hypothetical protein